MTILNALRERLIKHKHKDTNNNNDSNNDDGAIMLRNIIVPVVILLCLVPLVPIAVMGQEEDSANDVSEAAVNGDDDAEAQDENNEEESDSNNNNNNNDDEITAEEAASPTPTNEQQQQQQQPYANTQVLTDGGIAQDGTVTTATPENGIQTQPLDNTQKVQESITGTPMGPEVTNPGVNPRATLPQSTQMQEFADFQAALAQNGYNFNDNSVIYTNSVADGRTVMIILGTEQNTNQPPAMILDQLATSWGFQMLTYAYNTEGQLVTVFLEAF